MTPQMKLLFTGSSLRYIAIFLIIYLVMGNRSALLALLLYTGLVMINEIGAKNSFWFTLFIWFLWGLLMPR